MKIRSRDRTVLGIMLLCFAVTAYILFSAENHFMAKMTGVLVENSRNMELEDDKNESKMPTKQTSEGTISQQTTRRMARTTVSLADDFEGRFHRRRKLLKDACAKHERNLSYPQCQIQNAGFNYKYVHESNLVYCAIEKTGSTFWKRILHVVGGWSNVTNPTSIKSEDADSTHGGFKTLKGSAIKEMQEIFNTSNSLMFVRDPFSRLFSAWLDKFYSPNHYYWSNYAPHIVNSERLRLRTDNVTGPPVTCASDISFREFIKFTVKSIQSKPCVDGHFSPNYQHCLPCVIPFDYIGKYETLKEDTFYLLDKLNLSHKVTFDDFDGDTVWDAIRDSGEWVFSQKENIMACNVSFHCALFKLWNRMQSRGILSKKIEFPYKSIEQAQNITLNEFIGVLIEANRNSDPDETKANRKDALQQAFQDLPSRLKKRLVKAFEIDFAMFDYDSSPSFLNMKNPSTFKYFKECQEIKTK